MKENKVGFIFRFLKKKIIFFYVICFGLSSCTTQSYSPYCVEWYTPVGTAGLSYFSNLAVSDPTHKEDVRRILANEFKYEELHRDS